ncbi:MAG: Cupin domain protein [Promethearchaeota archaeon]|jgi:quercetin dioxygenase-like cupin family protein|nr:MAG: Cupin domain protein [Candidatus Lokiarchaeota archaeon]
MPENPTNKDDIEPIQALEGIYRKTLIYNENVMLCLFYLDKNASIPIHNHEAHQIGYILKGKIKFLLEDGSFLAEMGDSYVFNSMEKHGAEIIEDSEVIEVFSPSRNDYK